MSSTSLVSVRIRIQVGIFNNFCSPLFHPKLLSQVRIQTAARRVRVTVGMGMRLTLMRMLIRSMREVDKSSLISNHHL